MVDPRIYRAGWVIVFVAVVVFGFSLQSSPSGDSTSLAPGASFASAWGDAAQLARTYGVVAPGSSADQQMAGAVATQLRAATGFTVSTRSVAARTTAGERAIPIVEAQRPGLGQGTVVVVANRDGTLPGGAGTTARDAIAATSASAVLVDIARATTGATLNRSLLLVSLSGSVGASGATQLARSLTGGDVDAVIVLGDLAGSKLEHPVAVPWSDTGVLSPPTLVATVDGALAAQAHINSGFPSFGSELAQLAFPFAGGSQAPFSADGIPAVGISLSGDRLVRATQPTSSSRLAVMGLAVDQTVDALDGGASVPAPSAYLTVAGQEIPLWAMRLLVLGLIVPVAITLLDALARARRRGHSVLSWIVWVISGVAPFIVGFAVIKLAGLSHLVSSPPGMVASGGSVTSGGVAVVVVALAATAASFRLLRPIGVQLASGIGWRRTPTSPLIEGAAVAMSIVMCALTLTVWVFNPFAAALLIPALHLWMWLGSPAVVISRVRVVCLMGLGLALPALIAVYYMLSLGIAPWDFAESVTLALAGGAVSIGTALSWCVSLGVLAGAVVLLTRASRAATAEAGTPVTVRGPVGYAGPGSLGGTSSALRR